MTSLRVRILLLTVGSVAWYGLYESSGRSLTSAIQTFLISQLIGFACIGLLVSLILAPPKQVYSPLNVIHPYQQTPEKNRSLTTQTLWRTQLVYSDPLQHRALFAGHRDRLSDWSVELPSRFLYPIVERMVTLFEIWLPSRIVPPPVHLLHMFQAPGRLQVVRCVVLLGIPELLADKVVSLRDLHKQIATSKHQANMRELLVAGTLPQDFNKLPDFTNLSIGKLERLMSFAVAIGFFDEVAYAGSHIYVHNAQSAVLRKDHPNNLNHQLLVNSNEYYLVWHHLLDAILTPDESSAVDDLAEFAYPLPTAKIAKSKVTRQEAIDSRVQQFRREFFTSDKSSSAPLAATASSRTTKTAWEQTIGLDVWDYYKINATHKENFASAMSETDALGTTALLVDYEWAEIQLFNSKKTVPIEQLIDIGGSLGSFISSILGTYTSIPRATLFDLPASIEAAKSLWDAKNTNSKYHGLTSKVELVGGDFFSIDTIPRPSARGATKYILRQILHDWTDHDSMRILSNLRQVIGSREDVAVVLIDINRLGPGGSLTHVRHWMDFHMLVAHNAQERTEATWKIILEASGWRMTKWIYTRSIFQIIELQPLPLSQ